MSNRSKSPQEETRLLSNRLQEFIESLAAIHKELLDETIDENIFFDSREDFSENQHFLEKTENIRKAVEIIHNEVIELENMQPKAESILNRITNELQLANCDPCPTRSGRGRIIR